MHELRYGSRGSWGEDIEQAEKNGKAGEVLRRKAKAEEYAAMIVAAKAERVLFTFYVARDSGESGVTVDDPTSNGAQFVL